MIHITQTQYDQIKDVLPVQRGNVEIENIVFLNAILSIDENGCKWRKCCLAGVPASEGIRALAHHFHADATLDRKWRLDS